LNVVVGEVRRERGVWLSFGRKTVGWIPALYVWKPLNERERETVVISVVVSCVQVYLKGGLRELGK
jgi:hypothetical protein